MIQCRKIPTVVSDGFCTVGMMEKTECGTLFVVENVVRCIWCKRIISINSPSKRTPCSRTAIPWGTRVRRMSSTEPIRAYSLNASSSPPFNSYPKIHNQRADNRQPVFLNFNQIQTFCKSFKNLRWTGMDLHKRAKCGIICISVVKKGYHNGKSEAQRGNEAANRQVCA